MRSIPSVGEQNVQYVVQVPVKEEKNFFEGVMWGINGVQNVVSGVGLAGSMVVLDVIAIGVASVSSPDEVLIGAVGLIALNVLASYIVKAEFSIASKSFTHMSNTIL